jgi:uncharacterized DUF497 family protein
MKYVDWNEEKNSKLKLDRGIGFEDILTAIDEGGVLDDIHHPNPIRYRSQRMLVVLCRNYVYLVPYVEDETKIFMKTIIPSRKATKHYIEGGKR